MAVSALIVDTLILLSLFATSRTPETVFKVFLLPLFVRVVVVVVAGSRVEEANAACLAASRTRWAAVSAVAWDPLQLEPLLDHVAVTQPPNEQLVAVVLVVVAVMFHRPDGEGESRKYLWLTVSSLLVYPGLVVFLSKMVTFTKNELRCSPSMALMHGVSLA